MKKFLRDLALMPAKRLSWGRWSYITVVCLLLVFATTTLYAKYVYYGTFGGDATFDILTVTSQIKTDTINEKTSAAGVTVDSVRLKDGNAEVNADTMKVILDANNDGTSEAFYIYKNGASGTLLFTVAADGSIFPVGDLGSTGTRAPKGWFTDTEITNIPTVGSYGLDDVLNGQNVITVDANAAADIAGVLYNTIQEACTYVAGAAAGDYLVNITPGTYVENVTIDIGATKTLWINGHNAALSGSAVTGASVLTISDDSFLVCFNLDVNDITNPRAAGIALVTSAADSNASMNRFYNCTFSPYGVGASTAVDFTGASAGEFISTFVGCTIPSGAGAAYTGIKLPAGSMVATMNLFIFGLGVGVDNTAGILLDGGTVFNSCTVNYADVTGSHLMASDVYHAKGSFADIESTNMPTVSGTSLSSTFVDVAGDTMSGDLNIYDAVNDGNPLYSLGSAAAERLTIAAIYNSGAQTIDYVKFETTEAGSTADKGQYKFLVDGVEIMRIDDGGAEFAVGGLKWGAGADADFTCVTIDRASTDATFGWNDTIDAWIPNYPIANKKQIITYTGAGSPSANQLLNSEIFDSVAGTITLPDATAAMVGTQFTVTVTDAVVVSVDPDASDQIRLNGTLLTAGNKASSSGAAGCTLTFTCSAAGYWETKNADGVWIDGGA